MALIQFEKFNLNQFYEKSPKALKYIVVISVIIVGSYFLYAKKIDNSEERQLDKIEETIATTYTLINSFDEFRKAQYVFNDKILEYMEDIYTLVEELNENTNRKFDLILQAGGSNTNEIIERLTLLNESFDKLQDAYQPKEFKQTPIKTTEKARGEVIVIQLDENGNPIDTIK